MYCVLNISLVFSVVSVLLRVDSALCWDDSLKFDMKMTYDKWNREGRTSLRPNWERGEKAQEGGMIKGILYDKIYHLTVFPVKVAGK